MDVVDFFGYFCFYFFGVLFSVCPVSSSHSRRYYHYNSYYYYYYEGYDGSASMVAGSIIGGLIALCIVIAIVIVVVHACNCCKTHGIRGHTIRQTPIATVTSRAPYSTPLHNNWSYIPPTAPPYQPLVTKPPQYTSSDVNPPPAYEDISVSSPPSNTTFQGISSPASPCPPYSEMRS
ncbi:uncharacterized protein LOC143069144 [Mytilus galloprovincialis]|uniref:uncharacterized protein LOC143069144 n=1 Tax=Mytilus galloprovincialis TaxID=29158 RepID=UPI003F7C1BB2